MWGLLLSLVVSISIEIPLIQDAISAKPNTRIAARRTTRTLKVSKMTPISDTQLSEIVIPVKNAPGGALVLAAGEGAVYLPFDGKSKVKFDTGSIPDMASGLILDFSSDGEGGVYLLVQKAREDNTAEYAIAIFDLGGKFKSLQKLDINFLPIKFAVLGQGTSFVITGSQADSQHPRTVICDDRGQFLRDVVLEKDTAEKWASDLEKGIARLPTPGGSTSGSAFALYKSFLDRTEEGDVFLVRRENGLVYIIKASGVAHSVKLPSPDRSRLLAVKVARNRIAAVYSVRTPPTFQGLVVLTDMDGKKLTEYSYDAPALGFGVVEYSPHRMVFLGTPVLDEGRSMAFVEAVPAN